MKSRERVMAVFQGKIPDRVPMWCGASPEFMEKARKYLGAADNEGVLKRFRDDFRRVYSVYCGPELPERTSVFGVKRGGIGYGQALSHPLAEATLEDVEKYPWPDPDWYDVRPVREAAEAYGKEYAVMGGEWSPFFHDAVDLMGMQNMMVKMYEEPEVVQAVFRHIVDFYLAVNKRIFEAAGDLIDIFFFGNDFGSQNGPLVGGETFRTFLKPQVARLCSQAHEYGLYTMLHCCGSISELIPDLIDAGLDALQSLQPVTPSMQADVLKKAYGGKIIMNGCVNSVTVLLQGTEELARAETKRILDIMAPGGGFILSPSHDYLLEETPVENVIAMYDTAYTCGVYPSI